MKKLYVYLFLVLLSLQTPSQADDIRDFQIEGMSLGDSLLDYFSESEINNKKTFSYKSKKYATVTFEKDLEIYDEILIDLINNDKKFIIHTVSGFLNYENKIDECLKKKKEIVNELIELVNKKKIDSYMHYYDNSRLNIGLDVEFKSESKSHISDINFDSGDKMRIWCDDWSDEVSKKRNWPDALNVNLTSKSFDDWLINESEGQ